MGTILKGKCGNCGYEAEVCVGGGLRDCMPETVRNATPEGEGITDIMKNGASIWIERCPSECKACQKIVTGTYVCCQMPNEAEIRRLTRGCPVCGGPLRRYLQNTRGVSCPVCTHVIEMLPSGHWD